jgi:hypothetical protein
MNMKTQLNLARVMMMCAMLVGASSAFAADRVIPQGNPSQPMAQTSQPASSEKPVVKKHHNRKSKKTAEPVKGSTSMKATPKVKSTSAIATKNSSLQARKHPKKKSGSSVS